MLLQLRGTSDILQAEGCLQLCPACRSQLKSQHLNLSLNLKCAGNGSQWPKMGLELLSESPAYSRGVKACAEAVKPFGIDLIAAFNDEAGFSEDPILAAVGLIALQVTTIRNLRVPPRFFTNLKS